MAKPPVTTPHQPFNDVTAERRRGRGAGQNTSGRFEHHERVTHDGTWNYADCGWPEPTGDDEPPPLTTTVSVDATRTIIARNDLPDIGFNQSINPYRGCEHGCIYCFARPSHEYLGFSAGLDFETKILAKPNAAELLRGELAKRSYRCQVIAMGTNTDPYQPTERKLGITRSILEVLSACNHPVGIVTKSHLVTRDVDILSSMAARGLAKVHLSITTLDRRLARRMEPRAATPPKRLEALKVLSDAGVPVGVMAAPIIPGLNDAEIEAILEAAVTNGAKTAAKTLVRLPYGVKDLFKAWLEENVPMRAARVMAMIHDVRDGRDNDPRFFARHTGSGPYAAMLDQRFHAACRRLGLNAKPSVPLDVSRFVPPRDERQLAFL